LAERFFSLIKTGPWIESESTAYTRSIETLNKNSKKPRSTNPKQEAKIYNKKPPGPDPGTADQDPTDPGTAGQDPSRSSRSRWPGMTVVVGDGGG
jgi:hypothetical protein